jgi:hypothetical protein
MKQALNLNAMGVTEMNCAEMRETDGGCFAIIVAAVVAVATVVDAIFDIEALETPADLFR